LGVIVSRRTILLVDDTKTIRAMERALLGANFDYLEAEDGKQALELASGPLRPDLILMDITMPVLDGLGALAALKKAEQTRDIPVIMVTSEQDEATRMRCQALGCAGFVIKPIRWQALTALVQKILPE
jgi:CheY-like chemotaxis protein